MSVPGGRIGDVALIAAESMKTTFAAGIPPIVSKVAGHEAGSLDRQRRATGGLTGPRGYAEDLEGSGVRDDPARGELGGDRSDRGRARHDGAGVELERKHDREAGVAAAVGLTVVEPIGIAPSP